MEFSHIPVLKESTIELLNVRDGLVYVDGTLGGGGHSKAIEEKANIKLLVGIDQDTEALEAAQKNLSSFNNVKYVNDNFKNIDEVLDSLKIDLVDGILVDIGVSSYQIDNAERGFSFKQNAKLDMRMSRSNSFSAYELVNTYLEDELARVIRDYGEEKFAKSIARHIVKARETKPVETTKELEEIILSSVPRYRGQDGRSNVQRTFQAIRIEVNGELEDLESVEDMIELLNPKGRLCIITFHPLEDRIIKNSFKLHSTDCLCPANMPVCVCKHKSDITLVSRKPIIPTKEELLANSRSASAKLRVIEKK